MGDHASPQTDSLAESLIKSENADLSVPAFSHEGHRARLLDRFLKNSLAALHPHEILELLLTFTIPRRDTKPIAKALLAKFKSVSAVINASVNELREIDGIGERTVGLFYLQKDLISYCLREKYEKQSIISHRKDVEEYLRFSFGQRHDEYVATLFLDNANHILKTEILSEGTVNQCTVYPRIVFDKALKCSAASFILAHNHPGGSMSASEADWRLTERLYAAGKLLEIPLLDHIIITSQKVLSLREMSRWPSA
jgi:DNA repair protein RadC